MTQTGGDRPRSAAQQEGALGPRPGLRARKKAATMRHVQATALALFAERGYDAVSIEQVAEVAEVSPSTVYRYFATKEGLVLHDEHDDVLTAALEHHFGQGRPSWEAIRASVEEIWERHVVTDAATTLARMRLWSQVPSIRAAGYLLVEQRADELAALMAGTGRWSRGQARIIATGVISMFVAALRNWHETDGRTQWSLHIEKLAQWVGTMVDALGQGPEVPGAERAQDDGAPPPRA